MDAIPQRYYWRHLTVPSRVLRTVCDGFALDCTTIAALCYNHLIRRDLIFGFRPPRLASSVKKALHRSVGLFFAAMLIVGMYQRSLAAYGLAPATLRHALHRGSVLALCARHSSDARMLPAIRVSHCRQHPCDRRHRPTRGAPSDNPKCRSYRARRSLKRAFDNLRDLSLLSSSHLLFDGPLYNFRGPG